LSVELIFVTLFGALTFSACWFWILRKWQRGLDVFLFYTPISGAIQLLLFPASWPVLIKDILFVSPMYIAFLASGHAAATWQQAPKAITTTVMLFIGLVILQMFNPFNSELTGVVAPLIGAKVWLFYVPMIFVGIAYVDTQETLIRLSRMMLCLPWLPCLLGIVQYAMSQVLGYERTMHMFYGDAALAATQQLTTFKVGLMRIPSTFSSVTQYSNFILCSFVPALGLKSLETDPRWRRLCLATVCVLCVAGALCGARVIFVAIPFLLGVFYFLKGGFTNLILPGLVLVAGLYAVLSAAGIDVSGLANLETELVGHYSMESQETFIDATSTTAFLGEGVGSNTGEAQQFVKEGMIRGVENYYAKIVIELGIVGLIIISLIHFILIYLGIQSYHQLKDTDLGDYAAIITALLILTSVYDAKGIAIDFDPLNMLYWLFAGIVIRLPSLHVKYDSTLMQYSRQVRQAFMY
jgi:hypothetical protein